MSCRARLSMMHLPDAKRVRRDDLQKLDYEDEPRVRGPEEAKVRARLYARCSSLISLDLEPAVEIDGEAAAGPAQGEREQPEFSFRLFASSQGPATKVVLSTADEDMLAHAEGTVVEKRPLSFYLRVKPDEQEQKRLQHSAVSGEEVLRRSRQRAWGLEVPWRVVQVSMSKAPARSLSKTIEKPSSPSATSSAKEIEARRKRPGKKRRIAYRIKEKARREKEAAEVQKKLTKEEHLKEKKKRLNRERKLKRRQKEREKKLGSGVGRLDASGDPDDGTSSG